MQILRTLPQSAAPVTLPGGLGCRRILGFRFLRFAFGSPPGVIRVLCSGITPARIQETPCGTGVSFQLLSSPHPQILLRKIRPVWLTAQSWVTELRTEEDSGS